MLAPITPVPNPALSSDPRSTYPRHLRRGRPITRPRHRLTSYDTRLGNDTTLCTSSCPLGLARTAWEWGRRWRPRRLGKRRVVTLCPNLRERYVALLLKALLALHCTLALYYVQQSGAASQRSELALPRALACVATRVEGVGSSRTRRLCLGLGDILL